MTINLKATVRYDGTGFAGWQVQPDQPTVQGALEDALSRIAGERIRIAGASRTDAGVHALGQVFSCPWSKQIPLDKLRKSLSSMLRPAIRIENIEQAPPDFHARKSAVGKRYAYVINLAKHADPFMSRCAWTVPWSPDFELMGGMLPLLEGTHDFAGFQAAGATVQSTTRTINAIRLCEGGIVAPCDARSVVHIEFHADGFLYKMVRNITGTLVDIARGVLPDTRIHDLLNSPGPYQGHTAPPRGLFLLEVMYPDCAPHAY